MKIVKLMLALVLLAGCAVQKEPEVEPSPEPPVIEEDKVVSFMAVGDNLIHGAIYLDAKARYGKYYFDEIYEPVKDFVQSKDIAYINQETILGGTQLGLSHYPMFNSPQEIGTALVNTGFDWVNCASNHSMDKFEDGIHSSQNFWDQYPNVVTTGLNRTEEEKNTDKFIERNGVKFGVLGYTYDTNGIPLPEGKDYLVNIYSKERIEADVNRIKQNCDSVIVSMHWGIEYSTTPSDEQIELAQFMADLGVDVIIGEHPHVIQPMEWVQGKNGNQTLVIYSLGNFLSAQDATFNMLGGCASFDIRKSGETGKITVENVKWYPTVNYFTGYWTNFKVYFLKDYTDELANNHGINNIDAYASRDYFIEMTKQVMNDQFEIVY